MRLLKLIVKASGKRGIGQGSSLSPLLSNIYLNEVDRMLEKAKEVSKASNGYDRMEYARWADDIIILVEVGVVRKSNSYQAKTRANKVKSRTNRREDKGSRSQERRDF